MSSFPPERPAHFDPTGYSSNPYAAGQFSAEPERAMLVRRPGVVTWYAVYCVAMAILYLLCAVGGGLLLAFQEPIMEEIRREGEEPLFIPIYGFVLLVVSIPLCLFYAAGPIIKRSKAAWIYGIVAIAFGMTSACCLPFSIPLLIFWVREDTKAYFGV